MLIYINRFLINKFRIVFTFLFASDKFVATVREPGVETTDLKCETVKLISGISGAPPYIAIKN